VPLTSSAKPFTSSCVLPSQNAAAAGVAMPDGSLAPRDEADQFWVSDHASCGGRGTSKTFESLDYEATKREPT